MINLVRKKGAAFIAAATSIFLAVVILICNQTGMLPTSTKNSLNARSIMTFQKEKEITIEGSFYDRNGNVLCEASKPGISGTITDKYSYSSLIGYNSIIYGQSGLRSTLKNYLYSRGADNKGADVTLTIDKKLQKDMYSYLQSNNLKGSITVYDADTGDILALVTRSDAKIDFNANAVSLYPSEKYKDDIHNKYSKINSFFDNNAVLAYDPPGSTFKVITATAMVENNMSSFEINDNGVAEINGVKIHNYNRLAFANTNLEKALEKSINTYFCKASLTLGPEALAKTAQEEYLLGKDIQLDFKTLHSNFNLDNGDIVATAQTSYGQGKTLASPLYISMWMAMLINENSEMVKPYLFKSISDDGKDLKKIKIDDTTIKLNTGKPEIISHINKSTAKEMRGYLNNNAVSYGLTKQSTGCVCYAKTGTAECVKTVNKKTKYYYHKYMLLGAETKTKNLAICLSVEEVSNPNMNLRPLSKDIIKRVAQI